MSKFFEKNLVPKTFLNTRHFTPVVRDVIDTAIARFEKDMGGLLEDPILEPTEKMKLYTIFQ